ncbi:MAG: hypothetical protein H7Y04_02470, partial [Verrucomicrobia bacterium]|nr:hypothetical protein [Cytophagales bacterium]
MKHLTYILVALTLIIGISQVSEAQNNRKQKRKTVVVRRDVRVRPNQKYKKTRAVHVRVNRKAHVRYVGMPRWGTSVAVV